MPSPNESEPSSRQTGGRVSPFPGIGLLGRPEFEPGMVVCVNSFGNLLNFHQHLHVMAIDGGLTPEGVFRPLPALSLAPMEGLSRQRELKMLRHEGLLTPERVNLQSVGTPQKIRKACRWSSMKLVRSGLSSSSAQRAVRSARD